MEEGGQIEAEKLAQAALTSSIANGSSHFNIISDTQREETSAESVVDESVNCGEEHSKQKVVELSSNSKDICKPLPSMEKRDSLDGHNTYGVSENAESVAESEAVDASSMDISCGVQAIQLEYINNLREVSVSLVRCHVTDKEIAVALKDALNVPDVGISPGKHVTSRFLCTDCGKACRSAKELMCHARMLHGKNFSFKQLMQGISGCPYCGKKFSYRDAQNKHERACGLLTNSRTTTGSSQFSSKPSAIGGDATSSSADKLTKSKSASQTKVFSCLKCLRVFLEERAVRQHLRKRHKLDPSKRFYRVDYQNGKSLGQPKCAVCSFTSTHWKYVYNHEKKVHSKISNMDNKRKAMKSSQEVGLHYCSHCNRAYCNHSNLARHKKLAHKYTGTSLQKTRRNPVSLPSMHVYCRCHLCGIFLQQRSSAAHLRRIHHTSSLAIPLRRVFKIPPKNNDSNSCLYCDKSFNSLSDMYIHLNSTHKAVFTSKRGNVVKCSHCSLVFQNRLQLAHHVKTAHEKNCKPIALETPQVKSPPTEDLVFPCSMCGQVLSMLSTLEKHMRGVHYIKGSDAVTIEGIPRAQAKDAIPECKLCCILFESWHKLYSHLRKGSCVKPKSTLQSANQINVRSNDVHTRKSPYLRNVQESSMRESGGKTFQESSNSNCSDSTSLTCTLCDKPFPSEEELCKHLRKIHRLKEDKCVLMAEHARHSSMSLSPSFAKKLDSSKGGGQTRDKDSLPQNPPSSSIASSETKIAKEEVIPTTKSYESHSKSVTIFSCELCDMSYHSLNSLARHKREKHKPNVQIRKPKQVQPVSKNPSLTYCDICDFSTKYQQNLLRHRQKVHNLTSNQITASIPSVESKPDFTPPTASQSLNSEKSDSDSSSDSISSDSSSSDSSSDESEHGFALSTASNRRAMRLLSSSSDSSSGNEESEQATDLSPATDALHRGSSSDLDVHSISSGNASAEDHVHSSTKMSANQLLADEILQLDGDIFNINKQTDEGIVQETENQNVSPSKIPVVPITESTDHVCDSPTIVHHEKDISMQPKEGSPETVASVPGGKSANSSSVEMLGYEHKRFQSQDVLNRKSRSETDTENNAQRISKSDTENVVKFTPVAILKPFSSVPNASAHLKSFAENIANVRSSTVQQNPVVLSKHVASHLPYPSNLPALNNVPVFNNLPALNRSSLSSNSTVHSTAPVSYPVYLVDSAEYILPCVRRNIYSYKRFCLTREYKHKGWVPRQWYEDLSCYEWKAIALVPKPLECANEEGCLLAWLIKYDVASKSRRPAPDVLPRLNQTTWSHNPDISMVTAYRTIKHSAICCLCGLLTRDINQLNSHITHGHPLCTDCNKFRSSLEPHYCMPTESSVETPAKSVRFFSLSSTNSRSSIPYDVPSPNSRSRSQVLGNAISSTSRENLLMKLKVDAPDTGQPNIELTSANNSENIAASSEMQMVANSLGGNRATQLQEHASMANSRECNPIHSSTNKPSAIQPSTNEPSTNKQSAIKPSTNKLSTNDSYTKEPLMLVRKECDMPSELLALTSADPVSAPQKSSIETVPDNLMKHIDPAIAKVSPGDLNRLFRARPRPYNCTFCDVEFLLKLQLDHHMETLHKKCTICEKMFKDRQARSDHIAADHARYVCLACDHTDTSDQAIKTHIMQDHVDRETGLFNCTNCSDKQLHPEGIIAHLIEDDLEANRKCHLCHLKLSTCKTAQLKHFCTHAIPTTTSYCIPCNEIFLEPWALRWHFRRSKHASCASCMFSSLESAHTCPNSSSTEINPIVKDKAQQKIQSLSRSSSITCRLCFQVIQSIALQDHCDLKHSEQRAQCKVCGQRFEFDHQKSLHMVLHRTKKSWKYQVCATCLNLQAAYLLDSSMSFTIHHTCSKCAKYLKRQSSTDDAGTPDSPNKKQTIMEVAVSIEDVHTEELDSGDLQLMLDGKLYNFVPEESLEDAVKRQIDTGIEKSSATQSQCRPNDNQTTNPKSKTESQSPTKHDVMKSVTAVRTNSSPKRKPSAKRISATGSQLNADEYAEFDAEDIPREMPSAAKTMRTDFHDTTSSSSSDSEILTIDDSNLPSTSLSTAGTKPQVSKPKFVCHNCGGKFSFMAALNKHLQMKHGVVQ